VATFLWDKVYRDTTLSDAQKLAYAERGLAHVDRALALDGGFWEAMAFKGLLLRAKASVTSDPVPRQRLMEEAAALQQRVLAMKAAGVPPHRGLAPAPQASAPAAPSPPPGKVVGGVPGGVVGGVVSGLPGAPPLHPAVRVGGQIQEPRKLRDVPPVYPEIAKDARVQGLVILECTVGPDGAVVDVKVLRSIPLLDEAAIESVRQWRYAPTLLNGVPVPVIMTVTVNFKLS
jgi:TonB family protein